MTTIRRVARWLVMLPAFIPAGCHYAVTGPALWAHNSSSAFDAWVGLWIVALAVPFWAVVWASNPRA